MNEALFIEAPNKCKSFWISTCQMEKVEFKMYTILWIKNKDVN